MEAKGRAVKCLEFVTNAVSRQGVIPETLAQAKVPASKR
jgi:hypothetical protein